jgi:hypothetical protein
VLLRLLLTVTARGNPFLAPAVVARGVVPLKQLVLGHNASQAWTTIELHLELNGLPAGEAMPALQTGGAACGLS